MFEAINFFYPSSSSCVAPIINFSRHKNSINDLSFYVLFFDCQRAMFGACLPALLLYVSYSLFLRLLMFMPKKNYIGKEDNGRVEFNRRFYLASCCESINSETTILIDIIDSNNVPLRILWLYLLALFSASANLIQQTVADAAAPIIPMLELMKKFLIN